MGLHYVMILKFWLSLEDANSLSGYSRQTLDSHKLLGNNMSAPAMTAVLL